MRSEMTPAAAAKEKADAKLPDVKADLDSITSFYNIAVESSDDTDTADRSIAEQLTELDASQAGRAAEATGDARRASMTADQAAADDEAIDEIEADRHEGRLADLKKRQRRLRPPGQAGDSEDWRLGDCVPHAAGHRRLRLADQDPAVHAQRPAHRLQLQVRHPLRPLHDLPPRHRPRRLTPRTLCASLTARSTPNAGSKLEQGPKQLHEAQATLEPRAQGKRRRRPEPARPVTPCPTMHADRRPQINEFAAHPRLDLFVDSNSPHPAEKFGCTICHAGQGSAHRASRYAVAHAQRRRAQKKRLGQGARLGAQPHLGLPDAAAALRRVVAASSAITRSPT